MSFYLEILNQAALLSDNASSSSACFKRHSQLATYHFVTNLHITETRSIPFLTKYDKNVIGAAKAHSKTGFFSKRLKIKQNTASLKNSSRCTLISGWDEHFSK